MNTSFSNSNNTNMQETKNEWGNWELYNQENGNVFQSRGFAEALKNTDTETKLLILRDQKGNIIGGTYYFFPLSGIKKRFSELRVISGPILDNPAHFPYILKNLEKIAKNNSATSIQIRLATKHIPLPNHQLHDMLRAEGFTISEDAPTYSFNINLNQPLEQLKTQLNKKTRNAINKAEREGVIIKQSNNIDLAYHLYINRTKQKISQIPIPKSYFKQLYENLNAKLFVAYHHDKPIAESMFFEYNNTIYYFNNGSLPEYWCLNPNTLLVWHIIKINANTNKTLNLYGVPDGTNKTHHSYGIYKFKSGFGGTLDEEFIYASKVISPTRKWIFKTTLKFVLPIYKRIKR